MTTTLQPRATARYGWLPDLPDPRDHQVEFTAAEVAALPAKLDLRDTLTFPAPYDQGQLGSCTANAIGAALEVLEVTEVMPSRLFIYYNERYLENTVDSDSGAAIRDGIKVVHKAGVCPESEWPYHVTKFKEKPSAECYSDALKECAISYARVQRTEPQLKAALAAGSPVVVGISVYASFESEEVAQTGVVPMPDTKTEEFKGGHAVLVIGYDDAAGTWLVRNSWGPSWGDAGYFHLPYEYLTGKLASDFWTIKKVGAQA